MVKYLKKIICGMDKERERERRRKTEIYMFI